MEFITYIVNDSNIRNWVEFLSWIATLLATVFGVPFIFFQLYDIRQNQKHQDIMIEHLTRAPKFQIGFNEYDQFSGQRVSHTKHLLIKEDTDEVHLQLMVMNVGTNFASEVRIYYRFSAGIRLAKAHSSVEIKSDHSEVGDQVWIDISHINIGQFFITPVSIRPPWETLMSSSLAQGVIHAQVDCLEIPSSMGVLEIEFRRL